MIYLNNIHGREHRKLFGDDAFYDLDLTGHQVKQWEWIAPRAVAGQPCIVAKYGQSKADVIFTEFTLRGLAQRPERTSGGGTRFRVFVGEAAGEAKHVSKKDAAALPEYAPFFDSLGRFKRLSAF